ncbi:unnamed protein product [Penicillium olsonii]|uniref:Uncharacterized protein n=1 Tax=Penicillium olsonii TaxID=99116 RepID=A0A9W4I0G8_PENOL|nr:unnamed protein product [Penicillium olsonii]CAG8185742.1 unnamed protein product [Penicillium olsonii]
MFGPGSEHAPSSSVVTPALAPNPSSPSLFGSPGMVRSVSEAQRVPIHHYTTYSHVGL